jgi:hypothetical protein
MTDAAAEATTTPPAQPTLANYVVVYGALIATAVLTVHSVRSDASPAPREALVPPLVAMFGLIGVVWILMALLRNIMVTLGKASMRYYHSYVQEVPAEWIERPARTFNNLMQLPPVFYAVCLTAMTLGHVDTTEVRLAWMFVALRVLHALILLGWNFVPYRFAAYSAAAIALVGLTVRVAENCWPAG